LTRDGIDATLRIWRLPDEEDPWGLGAISSTHCLRGRHLVLSDGTNLGAARAEAHRRYAQEGAVPYHLRSPDQIRAFFEGLQLLDPSIVSVSGWRPTPSPFAQPW
jgi:S-adenosyl methyltransferase